MTGRGLTVQVALVTALAVAAGIHLGVAVQHRGIGLHGWFFAVAGSTQLVLAVLARRSTSRLVMTSIVMAGVGLALLWATVRLPAFTDSAESTGAVDLTATALAVLAALLAGARLTRAGRLLPTSAVRPIPGLALVAAVGLTTAVIALGPSSHDGHSHPGHHSGDVHHRDVDPGTTSSLDAEPLFGDLFEDHHGPAGHPDDDHPH